MSIYDKAHDLARAIRQSGEVQELRSLRDRIDQEPDSKRMLDDFRNRQRELQQKMMTGEMPPQDEVEKLEKLFEVISLNPSLRQLFETERRLGVILDDVQRIISEPIGEVLG